MQNPGVLDSQDQRATSCTEDAMTIEYLRARLLSERSISKTARERADELAKKVGELEEQLRTVTLQRKMAEKATADVLAILENQGISDLSEEFDSGSDPDIPCESGVSNDSSKEGERRYMRSKGRRHGSDELSGSHLDSSPVSNKNLSWKGRLDSPRSLDKYKTSSFRRQNSFSSISSSPKHRLGKSCRKIRHRQTRSVVEESRDKPVKDKCLANEFVSSSKGFPNCSDDGSNILGIESKIPEEDESQVNLGNKNHHVDGHGRENDMEEALEHRAQLIDQYEAMEKTQREWEEKFRENTSTTPDSCDQGNHSDMTEDKDESKAQIPYFSKMVTSNAQEHKAEPRGVYSSEELFRAETRDFMPKSYDDTRGYNNQKNATASTSNFPGQESSHSPLKGNRNESSVNGHCQSSGINHQDPHGYGYPDSKPNYSLPTDTQGGQRHIDASRNKNDLYALVSREQSHEFGGVLESLKQAKISLQQELNRLPLVESGYSGKAITPSAYGSKSEDRFNIPVGFSGLFRLPTDFSDEATARFNVHDSSGGFNSNFYLNRGISRTSDGQYRSNPYSSTMLSYSAEDQSLPTRYLENGSRFDSQKPPFDPFLKGGDKFIYPSFPVNPLYQNVSQQIAFGDELSRPYSSRTVGVPHGNHFSYHDDHLRR